MKNTQTAGTYKWEELSYEAQEYAINHERNKRIQGATAEYFKPLLMKAIAYWKDKAGFNVKVENIIYDISGAPGTGLSFTTNDIDVRKTLNLAEKLFPKSKGVIAYIKENDLFNLVTNYYKFTIERDFEHSSCYAVSCKFENTNKELFFDEDTEMEAFDEAEDIESFVDMVKNYLCEELLIKVSNKFFDAISTERILESLIENTFTSKGQKL